MQLGELIHEGGFLDEQVQIVNMKTLVLVQLGELLHECGNLEKHELLHVPIQHLHDCSLRTLRRCYAAGVENPCLEKGQTGHVETQCSIDIPHFLEERKNSSANRKNSMAQRIVYPREA
jgi:hypothetical protein